MIEVFTFRGSICDEIELSLPMQKGRWTGQELPGLGIREKNILKLDQHLRRNYTRDDGKKVFIYIGYWKNQSGDHQAAKHSPKTCLPSNGWVVQQQGERILDPEDSLTAATITAQFKSELKQYNYWFFSGEEIFHVEWLALLKIIKQRMFHGRSDGGIVEFASSTEGLEQRDIDDADEVLKDFYNTFKDHLRVSG